MRAAPTQALPWPVVEKGNSSVDMRLRYPLEAAALREELAKQTVGVFVRAPLLRSSGAAGSQKYTSALSSCVSLACAANSFPLSVVKVFVGKPAILHMVASM